MKNIFPKDLEVQLKREMVNKTGANSTFDLCRQAL